MLDYDLHCHSNVSDGLLPPAELVARAAGRGVKFMALTDHDDIGGLAEAAHAAAQHEMEFITGVEISVSWRSHTLHIVGLHIDPDNAALQAGLYSVREGRGARARLMAESLARCLKNMDWICMPLSSRRRSLARSGEPSCLCPPCAAAAPRC